MEGEGEGRRGRRHGGRSGRDQDLPSHRVARHPVSQRVVDGREGAVGGPARAALILCPLEHANLLPVVVAEAGRITLRAEATDLARVGDLEP